VDSRARRRFTPSRRFLLFFAAIGVPCVVLVALSLRMLAQDRELAEKRMLDDRRRLTDDIAREVLSRLDAIRLAAVNRDTAALAAPGDAVALAVRVSGEHLMLPWEHTGETDASAADDTQLSFGTLVSAGEHDELVTREFSRALSSYRRALAAARSPSQHALALLLIARALDKAGRVTDATAGYRDVLHVDASVVDEDGIPFGLYAARRLLDLQPTPSMDHRAILDLLRRTATRAPDLAPPAVYMLRDVSRDLASRRSTNRELAEAQQIASRSTSLIKDVEQMLALQNGFPTLFPNVSVTSASASSWLPFGDGDHLWLVNMTAQKDAPFVVAVRANAIIGSLSSIRRVRAANAAAPIIATGSRGEPLGPSVPGLTAIFPPLDPATLGGPQRSFYLVALLLVLGMAVFGSYLFWRDVRREVRAAALRSQFVASVSHELKTPLTAIRMFAETLLLRRSPDANMREEYLETIVNESERLSRLLNNVLDFSKIEQGTKQYRLAPQSLDTIARSAVAAMQYPLAQQGFALCVDIEDNVPLVSADPDAIQQAVLNLLSNAMKYSGEGRRIDLRVKREGAWAVLSVSDRGLGIPAGEQHRIFEKFYRVGGPERDSIPGTGLGLTLVQHIANAHGGAVTVQSAPGDGSTFSLSLPLIQPPFAAAPAQSLAGEVV
jgi:signal transduction histidine kinase